MASIKTLARRGIGLLNLKKAPVRIRIVRAWLDQRVRNSRHFSPSTFSLDLEQADVSFQAWHLKASASARLPHSAHTGQVERFALRDPERIEACLRDAASVMRHEFDLLGSGPYRADCPTRKVGEGGYSPIDWALDPVRQLRFKEGFPQREWELFRDRPGNADVKFPWELARCQHFLTLAQAWVCSKNAKFAREVLAQIGDFNEKNPVGVGVNWTCTMDVGLRAASWAIALDLINSCDQLDKDALRDAYVSLYEHGHFIRSHLENTYETTSNHYLSNVVGLFYVGALFCDLSTGSSWLRFASKRIQHEIEVQVLPDGADFESSIPYHRLVCELFLASFRLSQHIGRPFEARFQASLVAMIEYLVGVLTPSGEMPCFGDCDDGRFMIATDYCTWPRRDPRHLLAPSALICHRDDWQALSPASGVWEAIWWGFDVTDFMPGKQLPGDHQELYPYAGAAVSRNARSGRYLLVTNSIVGTKGFGNHKHNDQLSFEYHDDGYPLIVDPGSYVYTSDFAARNMFRSTAYHNTLQVDGLEQNEFRPEWLFRMFETARPEHLAFERRHDTVIYEGSHIGYGGADRPIIHWRRFVHDLRTGELAISDRLVSDGEHDLVWSFHLHPEVDLELQDQVAKLRTRGREWRLSWSDGDTFAREDDTWYSPSYGVRQQTKALRLSRKGVRTHDCEWRFEIKKTILPPANPQRLSG